MPKGTRNPAPSRDGVKWCNACGSEKEYSQFTKLKSNKQFGLNCFCKDCTARLKKDKRKADPTYARKMDRRWMVSTKYGITQEYYEQMFAAQEGRCLICSDSFEVLKIDHNHTTGAVRGLLCNCCNFGLGHFKDNPVSLQKAIDYLLTRSS